MATNNSANYNLSGMTSTGIIKYDGTTLVSSSTALIDSSNRMTNTSQPLVSAYVSSTDVASVTGDGTVYTLLYDSVITDQNSNYNSGTGVFTAPIAGKYLLFTTVTLSSLGALHTTAQMNITLVGVTNQFFNINPAAGKDASNLFSITNSTILSMTAAQTAKVTMAVSGSTKTVGIHGNNTGLYTILGIYLMC